MTLSISQAKLDSRICVNILVYGRTGVGKTYLAGTAQKCPKTSPSLVIAFDPGTLSLAGSGIHIVSPKNFTEVQEVYEYLRHDDHPYKSVCLDSLTMAYRTSMYGITGVLKQDSNYDKLDEHVPPDRYDWLSSSEQIRRTVTAFRDLAYLREVDRRLHIIFTANEKMDEKSGYICPSLPGVLATEIGAQVDMLARLTIETVETPSEEVKLVRRLHLQEDTSLSDVAMAKVRTPWGTNVPSGIWNPTVSKILKVWLGSLAGGKRAAK